jgi:hypothetical protein
MFDALAVSGMSGLDLSKAVLAIGSLGTAAYGVVDATKAFGGGVSNRGFGDIRKIISAFIPPSTGGGGGTSALDLSSVLATLRANWLNGMPLGDQKSIAKALIKLNLTKAAANRMAAATGVDPTILTSVAEKMATGETLTQPETDGYGRFDLLLTALLDQGYQRADQRYRNSAKLLAIPVAIVLALLGARAVYGCFTSPDVFWKALIGGLLATPLAPVAKDLSSAIQAGTKLSQSWKK